MTVGLGNVLATPAGEFTYILDFTLSNTLPAVIAADG